MRVVPVSGALGAEIHDVDLRSMTDQVVADLIDAVHHYEVVFLPQVDLSEEEHLALGRALGEVSIFPLARLLGATEPTFQVITDGPDSRPEADYWHTDVTWIAQPPKYALLHAEIVPERGGDTLWASMTTAYDILSPTMQRMLDGLEILHDCQSFIEGMRNKAGDGPEIEALADQLRDAYPPVTHPLVRTHPDTGRRGLFLGGRFMRHIVGMNDAESRTLLDFLAHHIENPALHCRWRWQPGDLAIWDERSTNHRSAADHFPQARAIRRIEIDGDRPFFDPTRTVNADAPPSQGAAH